MRLPQRWASSYNDSLYIIPTKILSISMTVAMQGKFYQYKDNKGTNWPLYGNMQVMLSLGEGLFHLRNREVGRKLSLTWNGVDLKHCDFPVYLGVTLDRTLSYKQHIEKVKGKVRTRNNLLHKLANSSWGANTSTLRATALALCYSVAEYACPVWERSSHAKKVDASLNDSCRCITGCLRPIRMLTVYMSWLVSPHLAFADR